MLKLVNRGSGNGPPVDGEFLWLAATKLSGAWQIGESESKSFRQSTTFISKNKEIYLP
jgi:hypothetical protein